jgi:DNA-directed RNA polymerase subunit RPC12/RpoP
MADYVTCPTCGSKVLTADPVLGRHVRCFGCGSRFLATPDPPAPERQDDRRPPPTRQNADDTPALPQFAGDDEGDEEEWPYCPGCGRQVSWEETVCPYCDEEFEEELPPIRPLHLDVALPIRRDGEPHRGRLLFTLGAVSAITGALSACTLGYLAVVSVPLGVTVWALASRDLRRMADGSVDPQGHARTRHARTAAWSGIAFGVLFAGVYLLYWLAR